jgi:hypothetical protein
MGQDGVLLRLVEPVDFVDEKNSALTGHAQAIGGGLDRGPQIGDTGGNRT